MMVSGHSSFEILQKYLAAGVSVFCAMSTASSLAVGVVLQFGMTLIGLLR
jgi:FdhD protein